MSNVFEQAANSAGDIEERLLGPTYPYWKNIYMPSEMGMNDSGSIQQMSKNIDGLIGYVELLASGGGKASKSGHPLGNKFFLQTGGKCVDVDSKQDVERYIYISNVPDGNIPFISSGMGVNFSELKGLIPGTLSDMNAFNPFAILGSFLSGSKPDCKSITMEVIDNNNVSTSQTQFVSLADISNINACTFPDRKNPVTNKSCVEAFENEKKKKLEYSELTLPDDPIVQLYFGCLSVLGIYILFRMGNRR
jgi:hypothetical protein